MIDIKVNFKIETEDFVGYEFQTKDDVFVEEMNDEFDLFRLEKGKGENDEIKILVASYEDFYVYDDATSDFKEYLLEIYRKCLDEDKKGLISDETEQYIHFFKEEDEKILKELEENKD